VDADWISGLTDSGCGFMLTGVIVVLNSIIVIVHMFNCSHFSLFRLPLFWRRMYMAYSDVPLLKS